MTQPPNSPPSATEPPPPVQPPRGISALVARRLWLDPHVRFWWLSSAVLLIVALGIALQQFVTWKQENRLIRHGVAVQAEVIEAGGISLKEKKVEADSPVRLKYEFNKQAYTVQGLLSGRTETIITGHAIDIHIDPNHPELWTYRPEPTSLVAALLGAMLVLPLVLAGGAVALWRRRALLRLWKFGPARPAIVVDVRQTALAPLSKLVRVTPRTFGDKRMYTVYVPHNVRRLAQGDLIWLIGSPDNAAKVAAAVWFE